MRHLLLASLVAMGTVAGGQGLQLPTLPIEWAEPVVWDPAWSMDTGSTAVLADTLEVRVLHVKPQFLNLFFERTRIIRFADDDGIQRHGHVQLPESLDPPMDKGERVWDPRAENPGPRWMNVRIDRVQARVLNADGTARPVEMVVHHRRWPVKNPTTVEHASSVVLDLVGIVPGDVVELRWKVMVPYDVNQPASQSWRSDPWMDNWARLTSWRIFFHDAVPVRDQQVSIRYLRKQGLTFAGEPPHIVTEEGEALTAIWHHTDLPGCMDEVNARPADFTSCSLMKPTMSGMLARWQGLSTMLRMPQTKAAPSASAGVPWTAWVREARSSCMSYPHAELPPLGQNVLPGEESFVSP